MNWYKDDAVFWSAVIKETNQRTGMLTQIIEKDIVQSVFLSKIKDLDIPLVFKGGTSLSKAYGIIYRFSEDIDLSVERKLTENERRSAMKSIKEIGSNMGLRLINNEDIFSRRTFNRYEFEFDSLFGSPVEMLVEASFFQPVYPVIEHEISSIAGNCFCKAGITIPEGYEIPKFNMSVQSLERTFVDKVFAVCDYYIKNVQERDSRHLYDIAKLSEYVDINQSLEDLVDSVRRDRMLSKSNPSASPEYDINELLTEIIKKRYYREDYNEVTKRLLYEEYGYEKAIGNGIERVLTECPYLFVYRPSPYEHTRNRIEEVLIAYESEYGSLGGDNIKNKNEESTANVEVLSNAVLAIDAEMKNGSISIDEVKQMSSRIVKGPGLGPLSKQLNKLDKKIQVAHKNNGKKDV